jgi:hypothetical protein
MGSVWMHIIYLALIMYLYMAYETYKVQRSLAVPLKKAALRAVSWPKYWM